MPIVAVQDLTPGMRISKPVYDPRNRVLLTRGQVLTRGYIAKLSTLGVEAVGIYDDLAPTVEPPALIGPEVRQQLAASLEDTFAELFGAGRSDTAPNTSAASRGQTGAGDLRLLVDLPGRLHDGVSQMIEGLLQNPDALIHLHDVGSNDGYILAHSIRVCLLSTMMGLNLKLDPGHLQALAIGGLLHDVGTARIPPAILKKEGALSTEEFRLVQQHTVWGHDILQRHDDPLLNQNAARIALHHHERWDGSGYPQGLKGKAIDPLARICALADCLDALISDRPYRPRLTTYRALHLMLTKLPNQFDPALTKALLHSVALYPVGSVVQLNSGHWGIVTEVRRESITRPKIWVLWDHDRQPLGRPYHVNLQKERDVHITALVEEENASDDLHSIAAMF